MLKNALFDFAWINRLAFAMPNVSHAYRGFMDVKDNPILAYKRMPYFSFGIFVFWCQGATVRKHLE